MACCQTAAFNATACIWDVTGTQLQLQQDCYQTATFNTTTCILGPGNIAPAPTGLACYQNRYIRPVFFWDMTGQLQLQQVGLLSNRYIQYDNLYLGCNTQERKLQLQQDYCYQTTFKYDNLCLGCNRTQRNKPAVDIVYKSIRQPLYFGM
jgi:hypothetical protein